LSRSGAGAQGAARKGSKQFFFEKKNQKTFVNLGLGPCHMHGLLGIKSFLVLFFKKELLSSFRLSLCELYGSTPASISSLYGNGCKQAREIRPLWSTR
jgi:hypothetical protein